MGDTSLRRCARHDLLWVGGASWAKVLAARPDIAHHSLAREWSHHGRPLIVRRATPCDEATHVPFGLPLPPAQGKHRIFGALPPSCIEASRPPPRLADAVASVPKNWRDTVDRLINLSPEVQTYGSLAWEHLTQLPYLSATSDLDLIWRHDDPMLTEDRLQKIARIDCDAPMRIDGEITNAAGVGVQWRELASGISTVIAKHIDGVGLLTRAAFLRGDGLC